MDSHFQTGAPSNRVCTPKASCHVSSCGASALPSIPGFPDSGFANKSVGDTRHLRQWWAGGAAA